MNLSWWEWLGTISGIAGVWFTIKGKHYAWLISLISISIYIYIFFTTKLYADFVLHGVYFFMTIYGWYEWKFASNQDEFKAQHASYFLLTWVLALSALAGVGVGYVLTTYSDASMPYPDALLSSLSIGVTWLMAKKYIQNWLLWVVIDFAYIFLFLYRQLYPTAILYLIFVALSAKGYQDWKKTLNKSSK